MRYQLTLVRMASIKKSIHNKCRSGSGEKGTLLHYQWECKLIQALWRTVWRFLKKLEIELPYDPAIPLLGIYPEETRIERHTYPNVHCSTIYNSQDMEATQMSINRLRKLWYIYTMEYYSAMKRSAFQSVLMRWMNLEPIIQSEESQKDNDKYCTLTHIYGIQKDNTDNPTCQAAKETQT